MTEFLALALAWFVQAAPAPATFQFKAFSYDSAVLGGARTYRVLAPAGYARSHQRYPVVYWLHGVQPEPEAREARLAAYVAAHNLILVDGGPEEPGGQAPFYFPELVEQIDGTMRTVADRAHRAVAGIGPGGFVALFLAGKFPDLIGSASSFDGTPEAFVGPDAFPVDDDIDAMYGNYDGVRIRLTQSSAGSLAFYHRRLDSIWSFTRTAFESATFLAGQDLTEIDRTLDFHLAAFALPLAKPAVFNHADAWPNFTVWGWESVSDRKQPGFTVLENVSNTGFRSSVRQYLPGGATIPEVRLSLGSPPIYPPGIVFTVTYIHLIDGKVRRANQRVDAHGRLNFELTGDEWEVGISNGPLLAVTGYSVEGADWATAGQPVTVKVRFANKGGARSATSLIRWESPNPGVKFAVPEGRLYFLAPGESASLPLTFTVADKERAMVRLIAAVGTARMAFDVPLYPPAEASKDFEIADGRTLTVFQHATEKASLRFGEGNGDGHAAPGETFAVLIPDSGALRAAEIFTNDSCVDDNMRGLDSWNDYDRSGASAKFSLPSIHMDCDPGIPIHMLARILVPNGAETHYRYFSLEFPVWYRNTVK
ncbi:MAG TPA: alpha/beta hydrolase-fold protein [Bryobacteraceae bacterium]|nr:alpha/beta hydrolase-fold protein [Bryobacteraceae bacterium]